MTPPTNHPLADNVRATYDLGWSFTALDGKRPILKNWTTLPRATLAQCLEWIEQGYNLGLRTGEASGVVVIDVDEGGDHDSLNLLPTIAAYTGGDGLHLLYACSKPLGNSAGKLGPHIDVKADGGQIVFAGSIHPETGKPYGWCNNYAPWEIGLTELQQEIYALVAEPKPAPASKPKPRRQTTGYINAALKTEVHAVTSAPEGTRNSQLNESAFNLGQLVGGSELDRATVEVELLSAAVSTGLPTAEAVKTIASGIEAGIKQPRGVPERATTRGQPSRSLDGGAGEVRREDSAAVVPAESRPFPVDVLPEAMREFVTEGAKALGCDPTYVALPLLSALAAAVGNTRRIRLKRTWSEPCVVWTAVIGPSGTLKTPAMNLALGCIKQRHAEGLKRYEEAVKEYELACVKYEADLSDWKKKRERDRGPPQKPGEPVAERCVCSDTTVEALAAILAGCPRGLLLARDELAGWVQSFDAYRDGRGGDAAHWVSMWQAGDVTVDRKSGGRKPIYVPRAAVSVTGSIQPDVLVKVLGRKHFENGLAARLLMSMPARRRKKWTDAVVSQETQERMQAVFDGLFSLEFDIAPDGECVPKDLRLTESARAVWQEFYNGHAGKLDEVQEGDLAAALSKLEAYAARFALLIHLVREASGEDVDKDAVDVASVRAGVALVDWFAHEEERIYSVLNESEAERERRGVVEYIRKQGGRVSARELMRCGPRFKTTDEAREALDNLAEDGLGEWMTLEPGKDGGRPQEVFRLHDT